MSFTASEPSLVPTQSIDLKLACHNSELNSSKANSQTSPTRGSPARIRFEAFFLHRTKKATRYRELNRLFGVLLFC